MRRIMLCVFFVIITTNLNAENIFNLNWNFGNIGLGMNYSSGNDDNIELTVSLINFSIKHTDANIGFEFSPIKYWHLFEFQDEIDAQYNGEKFSFINANMYCGLYRK